MKRVFVLQRILALMVCAILCGTQCAFADEFSYGGSQMLYVSAGAVGGNGTIGAPFGTLTEARDRIRFLKKRGLYPRNGVTVNLRAGKYLMNEALELGSEDSGTSAGPVTYRAYGKEKVEMIGGSSIALSNFSGVVSNAALNRIPDAARSKVKCVNLADYGLLNYGHLNPWGYHSLTYYNYHFGDDRYNKVADWMGFQVGVTPPALYFGGEMMTLARYPNDPEMSTITEGIALGTDISVWRWPTMLTYNDTGPLIEWEDCVGPTVKGDGDFKAHMQNWSTADDLWAYGYWQYNWADLGGKVKSLDKAAGTLTLQHPVSLPDKIMVGNRFYVYNLLEELDTPGEWYLDRNDGMLYFYPPSGAADKVSFSTLDDCMFKLAGASNIKFKNLNCTLGRSDCFNLRESRNITIELCEISMFGNMAVNMDSGGSNLKCISNHISNVGSGIWTSGGDGSRLSSSGNIIENNWIERFSKNGLAMYGCGDIARYNRINGCDNQPISVSGANSLFEYNEIYDVLCKQSDQGVIYSYQNVASPGIEIMNNYFHDIASDEQNASHGIMGVYVDGMGCGYTVKSNVFENFNGRAVFFNGGWGNKAVNNIFINCKYAGSVTSIGAPGGEGNSSIDAMAEQNRAIIEGFPQDSKYNYLREWLADENRAIPKQNLIKDNVMVNTPDFMYQPYSSLSESEYMRYNDIRSSMTYTGDPGFVNMSGGNYTLREKSAIYQTAPDFVAPDFENNGLYTKKLAAKLKNTLVINVGSNMALRSFLPDYIDNESHNIVPVIIDDRTYLPACYIAKAMGGKASFDAASGIATIEMSGKRLFVNLRTQTIEDEGDGVLSDMQPVITEDRTLLPIRAFEFLGKTVTWYDQGIVILGDGESPIAQNDDKLLGELFRRLS